MHENVNATCLSAVCNYYCCFLYAESEEELDSDEESGKDWDELEEEAKRGMLVYSSFDYL
jgi:hypothetical protein